MYILIENDEMKGFVKEKEEGKQYIEINKEEFDELMKKQSDGESLFYNKQNKKIDSIKLNQFEKLIDGKVEQSQEMISEEMENIEDRIDDTEDELEVVAKRIKKRIVNKRGTERLVAKQKNLNADLAELYKRLKDLGGMKDV